MTIEETEELEQVMAMLREARLNKWMQECLVLGVPLEEQIKVIDMPEPEAVSWYETNCKIIREGNLMFYTYKENKIGKPFEIIL